VVNLRSERKRSLQQLEQIVSNSCWRFILTNKSSGLTVATCTSLIVAATRCKTARTIEIKLKQKQY